MSRALNDLMSYIDTNLAYVTINTLHGGAGGPTTDELLADPTTRRQGVDPEIGDVGNGEFVFIKEKEVESIEEAGFRHEVWRIDLEIRYDSIVDGDDNMINAIKDHTRSLLNTNNASGSRTWVWFMIDAEYNEDPINGIIEVVVKAFKPLVSK